MKKKYLGLDIDLSRDENLTPFALKLLNDYYMREDEDSPQQAFARAALAYGQDNVENEERTTRQVDAGRRQPQTCSRPQR